MTEVPPVAHGPQGAEVPRLEIHWEGFWEGFRSSLRPALARSVSPLPGEMGGRVPRRRLAVSVALHAVGLMLVYQTAPMFNRRPAHLIDLSRYEMRVSSQLYLPQLDDVSGAESGVSGKAGGREAFHPRQTIRVARGPNLTPSVVEMPNVKLPTTSEPLANLLILPQVAPAVPVAAVNSSRRKVPLGASEVVPPPPNVRASKARSLHEFHDTQVLAPVRQVQRSPLAVEVPLPPAPDVSLDPSRTPLLPIPEPAMPSLAQSGSPQGSAEGSTQNAGNAKGTATADLRGLGRSGSLLPGFVFSTDSGSAVGISGGSGEGSLAMSPEGEGRVGFGGSGGGGGIGTGTGPGSGREGEGPGSGRSGTGVGADVNARGGISPGSGPGGSGNGTGGRSPIPGVSIHGGVVSIPSFGSGNGASGSSVRLPEDQRNRPAVTVVATRRAGGAMRANRLLPGSKIYTIYIETSVGTAFLQYAEPAEEENYDEGLIAPEPLQVPLPAGFRSRLLVICTLDTAGRMQDIRVLETAAPEVAEQVVARLRQWLFRPALRAQAPVAVRGILGFHVGTE